MPRLEDLLEIARQLPGCQAYAALVLGDVGMSLAAARRCAARETSHSRGLRDGEGDDDDGCERVGTRTDPPFCAAFSFVFIQRRKESAERLSCASCRPPFAVTASWLVYVSIVIAFVN